jgi:hypothetical protein
MRYGTSTPIRTAIRSACLTGIRVRTLHPPARCAALLQVSALCVNVVAVRVADAGVQAGMLSAMLSASIVMQKLGPKRKLIFGALAVITALGNGLLFCLPKVPSLIKKKSAPAEEAKPPVSFAA